MKMFQWFTVTFSCIWFTEYVIWFYGCDNEFDVPNTEYLHLWSFRKLGLVIRSSALPSPYLEVELGTSVPYLKASNQN